MLFCRFIYGILCDLSKFACGKEMGSLLGSDPWKSHEFQAHFTVFKQV